MNARRILAVLLAVVAIAAAVLSFAALRDLALLCGFSPRLAWLLPVVIDAGAAAGTLVWLGGWATEPARRFARALALILLGSSVAANALGHGLAAYSARPHWTVVVLVSAVAPAVLGACVHLAVLVGRPEEAPAGEDREAQRETVATDPDEPATVGELVAARTAVDDPTGQAAEPVAAPAPVLPPPAGEAADDRAPAGEPTGDDRAPAGEPTGDDRETLLAPDHDRVAALVASGAGRRRLSRELDITEHAARELLAAHTRNGHTPEATR